MSPSTPKDTLIIDTPSPDTLTLIYRLPYTLAHRHLTHHISECNATFSYDAGVCICIADIARELDAACEVIYLLQENGTELFVAQRQVLRSAPAESSPSNEIRIPLHEFLEFVRGYEGEVSDRACLIVQMKVVFVEAAKQGDDDDSMQQDDGEVHQRNRSMRGDAPLPAAVDPATIKRIRERTNEFIGLENQGATCYLNSLLQTLFHLRIFRKIICSIPVMPVESTSTTANGSTTNAQKNGSHPPATTQHVDNLTADACDPQKNCVVALQTLFYNMMNTLNNDPNTNPKSNTITCTTEDLTKSFGWDEEDVFEQHDVQELFSILLDKLETQLSRASMPNYISLLFEGKEQRYIKCLNVPYQSKNDQTYRDIQLTVENCKNLYESFEQYTGTELMTGSNQYKTDQYGMQDAKMGSIFLSFPPVLVLHLKRFAFDFTTGFMKKVDDRFEFDEEIELRPFLDTENMNDEDIDTEYVLYSVMVQAGSLEMGHYFNYIRPMIELSEGLDQDTLNNTIRNSPWYEFNDEDVSRVDKYYAIENNFGGDNKHSSAYMLVYIRKSQLLSILVSVGREIFPQHVLSIVQKQQEIQKQKMAEQEMQRLSATFELMSNDIIAQRGTSFIDLTPISPEYNGDGTISGVKLSPEQKKIFERCLVKCRKDTTYGGLLQLIFGTLNLRKEKKCVRLWVFAMRENKTRRPMTLVTVDSLSTPLQMIPSLRPYMKKAQALNLKLFVEIVPRSMRSEAPLEDATCTQLPDSEKLIFFKYIDNHCKLRYIAGYMVPEDIKLSTVRESMIQTIDDPNIQWHEHLAEEIDLSTIELRDRKLSLRDSELDHGDILILFPAHLQVRQLQDVYAGIVRRVRITLVPNVENKESNTVVFARRDDKYATFCEKVSRKLQWPSNQLRFYGFDDFQNEYNSTPFKTDNVKRVDDMLDGQEQDYFLVYEKLDESVENRESKKEFSLALYDGAEVTETIQICCSADDTLESVLLASEKINELGIPVDDLDVVAVKRGRIVHSIPLSATVDQMDEKKLLDPEQYTLRLEEVLHEPEEDGWVQLEVAHYIKGLSRLMYTDVPFNMNVNLTWNTETLRKHINNRLSKKSLKKAEGARIALMQEDGSRIYMAPGDVLLNKMTENTSHIGLERAINSTSKKLTIS